MLRQVVPAAFAAVFLILVGCGRGPGTIEGEIDGDEVGAIADAVFALIESSLTDEHNVLVVAGTADDLCTHLTEQYSILADMVHPNATQNDVKNGAGDLVDYINDNDLVGHWTFSMIGVADRVVDLRDENELDIDPSAEVGDDRMALTVAEQRRAPKFDENDGYETGEEVYAADEGSAAWSLDEDNRYVEVTGDARLRDDTGDKAGDIDFDIYATPCNDFGSAFVDFTDNRYANSCQYARDGECDEPTYCPAGTDTTDCG